MDCRASVRDPTATDQLHQWKTAHLLRRSARNRYGFSLSLSFALGSFIFAPPRRHAAWRSRAHGHGHTVTASPHARSPPHRPPGLALFLFFFFFSLLPFFLSFFSSFFSSWLRSPFLSFSLLFSDSVILYNYLFQLAICFLLILYSFTVSVPVHFAFVNLTRYQYTVHYVSITLYQSLFI